MRGYQIKTPKGFITQTTLKEFLHYDPSSGKFTWRERPAGSKHAGGYVTIHVGGNSYKAHRLAWLYMTGQWPTFQIDHVNCVPNDNRWNNLRPATASENSMNRRRSKRNKSGYKGVCYYPRNKKWAAYIYVRKNGQKEKRHLGLFTTAKDAYNALCSKRKELHGDFANFE